MSIFQAIADFFESIFNHSSPEVQKKRMVKKMEQDIDSFSPSLYKKGMLLPNFAEAVFILYKNTRILDNLFSKTVSSVDIKKRKRFEAQLIVTGFSIGEQEIISGLSFDKRKADILSFGEKNERAYIHQRKELERVLKELNTDVFKKMDEDILNLRHVAEFCHYNFVTFLKVFDVNFVAGDISYKPYYNDVPIKKVISLLEDLYYQMKELKITTAVGDAVLALLKMCKGHDIDDDEKRLYLGSLKKINYIKNRILEPEKLKVLIRLCKEDVTYEPDFARYTGEPRKEFAGMFKERFITDENRIKSEIQDETISEEVKYLFPDITLEEVGAYNQGNNVLLQNETPLSFKWISPLRILKTFLKVYLPPSIRALLNDISIEGFFNNASYKTRFASMVYTLSTSDSDFAKFEKSFENNEQNSIAVLEGYIQDSKKDQDFYNKLVGMVERIDDEAHILLQNHVTNLNILHRVIGDLLADTKKPSSELISNLKGLMLSSRNRDSTSLLESQYESWNVLFEIMKNYIVVNTNGELNHN